MVLNSWQRIDRVLSGKPFGDGADGSYNSSTIPTMTYRSCSGSSGSTTLTLGSAGFANGDLILIHQTRGTGAGQWEINQVVSTTTTSVLYGPDGGSSLSGWTTSGTVSIDSGAGNPAPSYSVAQEAYAYRAVPGLGPGTIIELDMYASSLIDFFFMCNASGVGQMFRLECRTGDSPGFASTSSWTTWTAPSGYSSVSANTWHHVRIEIGSSVATGYIDSVFYGTWTFTNNGNYIGLIGDRAGGGRFDNIVITTPSQVVTLKPLQYTYTDSGASQAQAIKIPRYTDVTVPSGATWTVPSWNGDTGGILVLAAKGTIAVNGFINNNGGNGVSNLRSGGRGTGGGHRGGDVGGEPFSSQGYTGEGTEGDQNFQASDQPDRGTGGSWTWGGGGCGGGNGTDGQQAIQGSSPAGDPGDSAGSSDLTSMVFGGGGGGGYCALESQTNGGGGGAGGGIIILFGKNLVITGGIQAMGGNGGNGYTDNWADYPAAGGGGGAGGSILLVHSQATLGSSLILATGGNGGSATNRQGGTGGVGRIALHYSGSYSGSTNPTLYAQLDPSLVEAMGGGAFLFNML